MAYTIKNGWFTEVSGQPVLVREARMPRTTWALARGPYGVIFHYTAGCDDDLLNWYETNGYGGAHFLVGRDAKIRQYAPLTVATWHAFEASHTYVGIEHTAYRDRCDLNDAQLEASAKLSAALADHFDIPVVKLQPPVTLSDISWRKGFLDHTDGPNALEAGGESKTWNKKGHVDGLYRWGWTKYLYEISEWMKGDDMAYVEFKKGVQSRLADEGAPPDSADPDFKFGYRLENRIQTGLVQPEPKPAPPAPHKHKVPGTAHFHFTDPQTKAAIISEADTGDPLPV